MANVAALSGVESVGVTLRTEAIARWEDVPTGIREFIDSTTANPFMHTPWLTSWYFSFLPNGWRPHILISYRGDTIVGVAPLIVRAIGPLRVFRFAGHGLGNYLDVISSPVDLPSVIASLLGHVRRYGMAVLEWHDLNSESRSYPYVANYPTARLYPNPRARFASDWESHWKELRAGRQSRRRYINAQKLLEARGGLEFVPQVASLDDDVLADIRQLHSRRFRGTPNPLVEARFWAFFRRLADLSLGHDLVISLLRSQGKLLSVLVGLRANKTYVSYLLAFDSEQRKLQPGHVHLMLFQQHLVATGWEALDFSKGEDDYKRRWSNDETWNFDMPIGFGPVGFAAATIMRARSRVRGWARRKGLTRVARKMLSERRRSTAVGRGA